MKITTGDRKEKRNVGFNIPTKKFRFCVRDEYGTKALAEQVMVKSTSLWRELELRTESRMILSFFYYQFKDILTWPAFMQNVHMFNKLHATLNDILKMYKSRRDDIGLFYLAPTMRSLQYTVRSPLYDNNEFRKRLRRNKVHECKNRGDNKEKNGSLPPIIIRTLRLVSKRHILGFMKPT
uniref:Uncharacterized protein n=1 Tax=Oryza glumipatula TaxID=40148 RepID=A0A0D9ZMQ7_9ORYZ